MLAFAVHFTLPLEINRFIIIIIITTRTASRPGERARSILGCVPSRLCPFQVVSLLCCVPSRLCPFYVVSLLGCVLLGCVLLGCVPSRLCPFQVMSLLGCVPSRLCPFQVVSFQVVSFQVVSLLGCVLRLSQYLVWELQLQRRLLFSQGATE